MRWPVAKKKYLTHVEPRLEEIAGWCREELIEAGICKRLGVCVTSLTEYKRLHPALLKAIKEGKEIADYRVEDSLYQRAMGMDIEETHQEFKESKLVSERKVTKHLAPDPTSMIFWMKNRRPKVWRDKQEVGGQVTINYDVPEIEKEEGA